LDSNENDILRTTFALGEIIVGWHRAVYTAIAGRSCFTPAKAS